MPWLQASTGMEDENLVVPLLSESEPDAGVVRDCTVFGTSVQQTSFNAVNLFLGIGLLSMPYAIKKGGWLSLIPLCLSILLFCLSAHLIILAFDRLPQGMLRTYPELGRHAAGKTGHRLVLLFALVELFGSSCIVLMVVWQQLILMLPPQGVWGYTPLQAAVLVTCCTLAPTLLIRNFKSISSLSMLGFSSSVLVTVVVLSLLPLDFTREKMPQQPPPGHTLASQGMVQAVGVFAVSVSGHSSLPSLRAAMQQPHRFPRVLKLTFSAMLVVYGSLAAAGYFYFGDSATPVVTTDLASNSVLSGKAILGVLTIDRVLAALILLSCFAKYPVLVMVIQDMLFSLLPSTSPHAHPPPASIRMPRPLFGQAVRFAVFVVGVAVSYSAHSVLGCVISLVGGLCSISCSLLLPTAFYSLLAWKDLGPWRKGGLAVLLVGGVLLVCLITLQNVREIISHSQQEQQLNVGAEGGEVRLGSIGALLRW